MRVHILGICGTFMGSLAVLAKQLGHEVSGCDANVYPPMSTQLQQQGITLLQGYDPAHLQPHPDIVIVGNAMSRGNPCVEYVLDQGLRYTSGPQWLCDHVLQDRWVLAVAGTHGKTTTTTMLAWILQHAGMKPGYLIGGVPISHKGEEFPASADLGNSAFFVIEADEYDSAFFDKRSKFVHYRPRTAILNNLEFDHADIFDSLADIQKQFHHLVRTIPAQGRIIFPAEDSNLREVLQKGCWSGQETFSLQSSASPWRAELCAEDGSAFRLYLEGALQGEVRWQQSGLHNVSNGMAAIAAARHVGVSPAHAIEALNCFGGVKRRMEKLLENPQVAVYDDFAHHPTAIKTTLAGLRKKVGAEQIIAVIEPRSNTMRMGTHKSQLAASAEDANEVIWYQPASVNWELGDVITGANNKSSVSRDIGAIVSTLSAYVKAKHAGRLHIVIMSNGGFAGIHQKLVAALQSTA